VAASPGVWRIGESATVTMPVSALVEVFSGGEYGWVSNAPGQKEASPVIVVRRTGVLPATLAVVFALGEESVADIAVEASEGTPRIVMGPARSITFGAGAPAIEWI